MVIEYNNVEIKSLSRTKDVEKTPDDRQTLVKTFNNSGVGTVTVEDYGLVANGEIISCSAIFTATDYSTIFSYFSARTKVKITLEDGTIINDARIVIRRTQYADELFPTYKQVYIEIWRV